jgi:hypothetical protein
MHPYVPSLAVLLACALGSSPAPPRTETAAQAPDVARLVAALAEHSVHLDPERKLVSIPVDVDVRDDLLEYLLVGPAGAAHESAFVTPVQASVLNTALLALALEPGTNAVWRPKDPPPSEAEMRAGASAYDVRPPEGDALYLYVGWRTAGETYFFRVEDLLRHLSTGASMRRHAWVYLGSRMVPKGRTGAEGERVFAADVYQNLVNISFFSDGYTLLTAALPECVEQTTWMVNAWLVPERGTRLAMVFSSARIETVAPEIASLLPEVAAAAGGEAK